MKDQQLQNPPTHPPTYPPTSPPKKKTEKWKSNVGMKKVELDKNQNKQWLNTKHVLAGPRLWLQVSSNAVQVLQT